MKNKKDAQSKGVIRPCFDTSPNLCIVIIIARFFGFVNREEGS